MFVSLIILLKLIKPDWKDVFQGLLPSKVRKDDPSMSFCNVSFFARHSVSLAHCMSA